MYDLKQNTAITVPVFVHDANGDAVTGLVDGGFTKRISKNGGAFAAMTVTITEMENGWYSVTISAAHSNTLGLLTVTFTHASAKQVNLQFRVKVKLTDDLNDAVTAPTAVQNRQEMDSNSTQLAKLGVPAGASISADILAIDNFVDDLESTIGVAGAGLTDITLNAASIDLFFDELLAGHAVAGTAGLLFNDWVNGGRLDIILDAIKAVTDLLPDAGALDDLALILADTGTDGVALSTATGNQIADQVLRRGFAAAAASGDGDAKSFRSLLGAVAKLVNKVSIAASTLTVTEADDTTVLGTQAATVDAAADPITALDTT